MKTQNTTNKPVSKELLVGKTDKYVKVEWTELINQIQPDIAVYGHQHDLYPFLEGQETMISNSGGLVYNSQFQGVEGKTYDGYLTDYTFNGFIVSQIAVYLSVSHRTAKPPLCKGCARRRVQSATAEGGS